MIFTWEGRKVIVAGSMKELGRESAEAHARVGALLSGSTADALFLFGEEAESAYRGVRGHKTSGRCGRRISMSLRRRCYEFVREGDIVLLKGSRSMELERLVAAAVEDPHEGG